LTLRKCWVIAAHQDLCAFGIAGMTAAFRSLGLTNTVRSMRKNHINPHQILDINPGQP